MFTAEDESFFIDDEPEYDVFQSDDLCSTSHYLIFVVSESHSPPASLELKPLLDSLKSSFLKPDESFPVIIASNLDRDQEEKID